MSTMTTFKPGDHVQVTDMKTHKAIVVQVGDQEVLVKWAGAGDESYVKPHEIEPDDSRPRS